MLEKKRERNRMFLIQIRIHLLHARHIHMGAVLDNYSTLQHASGSPHDTASICLVIY